MTSEPWMAEANCQGVAPETFFPSDLAGVEAAQRICDDCTVRLACLEYALSRRIADGVWGGASERKRRRLLARAAAGPGGPAGSPVFVAVDW